MNSPWKQLHPQDSYTAKLSKVITIQDERVLSTIYQPIIGVSAFGLYHALSSIIIDNEFDSQELLHSELFNQLSMDLPSVYNARLKLEGIGLLKVYQREQDGFRHFIYELMPPMSADQVFKDDVLSVLLLNAIGEKRFDQLVEFFAIPQGVPAGYQEVTRKFIDVYQFRGEQVLAHEPNLTKAKAKFEETEKIGLTAVRETFDWDYFMSLLNDFFLDKDKITTEVKETIYTLHTLYGINELTMRELVEPSVDYVANEIKLNQLRQEVIKKYHDRKNQEVTAVTEGNDLSESDQMIRRKNTMKQKGYSDEDIAFIIGTESYSPMMYLESIKDQKHGFIADSERYTVEGLVKRSTLPDSVINLLIHYILVIQGNASFNKTYAESIANDWAQSQIKTPEAAFEKVKSMISQGNDKKTKNNYQKNNYAKKSYQKKPVRRETTPDWVGQVTQETPVSQAAADELKERIKRLRENIKEGES